MIEKIKRALVDKRDKNSNMSLESLKQKQAVEDSEIRDYLDYLVDELNLGGETSERIDAIEERIDSFGNIVNLDYEVIEEWEDS